MGKAIAGMAGSKLGKGNKYSEMYNLYKSLGGKSAGYFNQGKGFEMSITNGSASHNLFDGIKSMLSIIGETGETVPRLAEFINTIETVGTSADGLTKALRNAAEVTVNFSRSAPLTKSLDAWVLYLNAAVQGLDKFARTVKAHPFRTTVRGSVLIGAPFAFLTAHNWDNPHYQDLSDRTKANYFCVPNLRGEMDSEGNPMTFIKVPLNREYGTIFGTALNLAFAQFKDGDLKSATEQLKESVKTNFLPQNPVTDNVFAPILINLPSNKDFANRAIVPANLEDVYPRLQYDANTSEAAMAISSLANNVSDKITGKLPSFESKMLEALKSPKKVDYLIDSYGGYLGTLVQSLGNSEMKQIGTYIVDTFGGQFDERFLTDARYSSKPITDFYNAKTEADIAYNSAKLEEDDKLSYYKAIDKIYTDASKQLSELSKAEKQLLAYDELNNSEKKSAVTAALSLIGDGVLSAEKLKDYNSKKTKLTDEEIKKIIGSMRTTKNNIAKVTKLDAAKFEKDYKANPNFAVLSKEVQAKYKKSYGSKEDFAKVYSIITTKGKDGKDVNGTLAKTAIALKNGLNTDAAYTLSGSESKKENYAEQVEWANYVAESGINITQTSKLKGKADTDGNGFIGKEEAMAYINKNFPMATRKEKAAKFYILCNTSSRKHNPYL